MSCLKPIKRNINCMFPPSMIDWLPDHHLVAKEHHEQEQEQVEYEGPACQARNKGKKTEINLAAIYLFHLWATLLQMINLFVF